MFDLGDGSECMLCSNQFGLFLIVFFLQICTMASQQCRIPKDRTWDIVLKQLQKDMDAEEDDAVAKAVEDAESLSSYSWREVLPTMALKLGFFAPQRISLSDWQDPGLGNFSLTGSFWHVEGDGHPLP